MEHLSRASTRGSHSEVGLVGGGGLAAKRAWGMGARWGQGVGCRSPGGVLLLWGEGRGCMSSAVAWGGGAWGKGEAQAVSVGGGGAPAVSTERGRCRSADMALMAG